MKSVVVAVGLIALLSSNRASADESALLAKEHYRAGTKLYDVGRYGEAAAEYEKAYQLKDDPALLFNMGQALRQGGEHQKALAAYRSYLRRLPDARNREEVVALIDSLRKTIEQQKQTREKPPTDPLPEPNHPQQPGQVTQPQPPPPIEKPVPPPPPKLDPVAAKRARTLKLAGIGVASVGAALAVTGGVFGGLALRANDRLNHPGDSEVYRSSLQSDVTKYQNTSIALLAVGGAAAVTGVAMAVVGLRAERPPKVAVAPIVGPQQVGVAARVTF